MPNHDFRCGDCGLVLHDHYVHVSVGATVGAPDCPRCEIPVRMNWIPAVGRMSLFTEREKYTTTVDDPASPTGQRVVTVSTLADIRRLERESEQAERNGEGRRMVWRDFSQDRSNTDVHTLGQDPSRKPPKTYSNGQPVVVRRGDPVVAAHGEAEE